MARKTGKKTYVELAAELHMANLKIKELQEAMRVAGRGIVTHHTERWCSVPLMDVQYDAIKEMLTYACCDAHGCGKQLADEGGEEVWEVVIDSNSFRDGRPLAEYPAILCKYTYTREDGVVLDKAWGLLPV